MSRLICPYTENCVVYREFAKIHGQQRDVIVNGKNSYSCLACSTFDSPTSEGGSPIPKNIQGEFDNPNIKGNVNMGDTDCSHITILNLLSKLR